jgi:hypothetical protein
MDLNNDSGIKFDIDSSAESYKAVKFYNETDSPKIVRLIMKYSGGTIKEEKYAYWALFGFVVLAIAVSLFLFFKLSIGNTQTPDKDAKAKFEQTHPGLIYK